MTRPVIRTAGLPARTLRGLQSPRTAERAESLAGEQEWLERAGADLSDALYQPIGTASGPVKPALVGLRRALHQGRAPRAREWSATVRAALPADLADRIATWVRRRTAWDRQLPELGEIIAAEHADRLTALRQGASEPLFRRGLWHASPDLSDELDRWLDAPHRCPRRSVQFRLAKYLSRASAKASVYSSFAVTGFGQWVPRLSAPDPHGTALRLDPAPDLRAVTTCDDDLRERLLFALVRQPGLRDALAVRVNPSHIVGPDGTDHWFLGPRPEEPVRVLKPHPALGQCLAVLAEAPVDGIGMDSLTEVLSRVVGVDPAALRELLQRLVDAGLLEVGPRPLTRPPGSLAGLADWAAAGDDPELPPLLRRLEQALRRAEQAADLGGGLGGDRGAHRAAHRAVVAAAEGVADGLGVHVHEPRAARDEVVSAGPLAEIVADHDWRAAFADLSAIRGWLGLFDNTLPYRAALRAFWDDHLAGRQEVPLLELYQRFRPVAARVDTVLTRPMFPEDLLASPVPGLAEVGKLRSAAMAELPVTPGQEQVHVATNDLVAVARAWPAWVRPVDEMTCYLQREGRQVVLNRLDPGYGKVTHRTGLVLRRAGGEPALPRRERGAMVLAELGGLHGTALNAREPCLPYEIDYPSGGSDRPADERISLADLRVSAGPDGQPRLHSARRQCEVHTVYTGALMLAQLPPVAKLLAAGFALPAPPYAVPMPYAGLPTTLRRSPRVSFGTVVVRRARWTFPPAQVPTRQAGEKDADYLLRLTRWRRRHGLPQRCFVRALPSGDQTLPADDRQRRSYGNQRKPFYFDFTSWLLVLAFENLLRTPRQLVVFEEALPDPAVTSRVWEMLVEVPAEGTGVSP